MRAVIFDLDGTIVDSRLAIIASLRHVQQQCGLAATDDDFRWALGPPLRDIMGRLLHSSDSGAVARAMAMYRAHHPSVCCSHARVYDGIEPAVRQLTERKHRLFVATSKLETVAREVLAHFALDQYFEGIHGSDMAGRFAEKADVIGHVLRTHRLEPSASVMVGDRALDVCGARAHAIRCAAVAYGYGDRRELEAALPDIICSSPDELVEYVTGL